MFIFVELWVFFDSVAFCLLDVLVMLVGIVGDILTAYCGYSLIVKLLQKNNW